MKLKPPTNEKSVCKQEWKFLKLIFLKVSLRTEGRGWWLKTQTMTPKATTEMGSFLHCKGTAKRYAMGYLEIFITVHLTRSHPRYARNSYSMTRKHTMRKSRELGLTFLQRRHTNNPTEQTKVPYSTGYQRNAK